MAEEKAIETTGLQRFHEVVDVATGEPKKVETATTVADEHKEEGVKEEVKKPADVVADERKQVDPNPPAQTAKPAADVAAPVEDWREAIKKVDPKEVMKLLGHDDFDIDFVTLRKEGGDPYKFLEVKGRDWNKIDDVEVLRRDLRNQFPTLDAESFDILAEKRINQRFGIGQEFADEREKKANDLEMKIEADKLRKQFAEEDAKLLIPDKAPDTTQADKEAAVQRQKEEFLAFVTENDATKQLLANKKITVGEGEESMHIDVDPSTILDFVQNPDKFFTLFHKTTTDPSGNVDTTMDMGLMYKAINYALNSEKMEKALIDYGKSLGTKAEVEDIHKIPKEKTPEGKAEQNMSLNERFTKHGVDKPIV